MRSILFLFCLLWMSLSSASIPSMLDQEPNNTPRDAQKFSDEKVIYGSLRDQDQDLYLWDITDADADHFWDIELQGLPERLTKLDIMQLDFTEDGTGVSKVNTLMSIRHINGIKSVTQESLVFSPGKYYLGLSYANDSGFKGNSPAMGSAFETLDSNDPEEQQLMNSGVPTKEQSDYTLKLIKKKKISSLEISNNSEKPKNLYLLSPKGFLITEQDSWYSFKINDKDSEKLWTFSGRVALGGSVNYTLFGADKKPLFEVSSDANGYYAMQNLVLNPGTYVIKASSSTPHRIATMRLSPTGFYAEGSEKEPNNSYELANKIRWDEPIQGVRMKSDFDYFSFDVSAEQSQNYIQVQLLNTDKTKIDLCIRDSSNVSLKCLDSDDDMKLKDLVLAEGQYFIYVYRGKENSRYELLLSGSQKRNPAFEAEPNDSFVQASTLNPKRVIRGTFDGKEFDFFKFNITEKPQLWTFQAVGNNISEIHLYNSAGGRVHSMSYSANNKRARLSNLFMMPGTHIIALRGENGKYLFRAFPTGMPDPDFESEPNNSDSDSELLILGQLKKGQLSESSDRDLYRFGLKNEEHLKLSLNPPVDAQIRYTLSWNGKNISDKTSELGQSLTHSAKLPPGEYKLEIKPAGNSLSDDNYSVSLERLPFFSCDLDCEPNNQLEWANKVDWSDSLIGEIDLFGDRDWFSLPASSEPYTLAFQKLTPEGDHYFRLYTIEDYKAQRLNESWNQDKTSVSAEVPANRKVYIELYGTHQNYHYQIIKNTETTSLSNTDATAVELEITGLNPNIAAYLNQAQKAKGELSVTNLSEKDTSIELLSHLSDGGWKAEDLPDSIMLKPREQKQIPFSVFVPQNSIATNSVNLSIAAMEAHHAPAETSFQFDLKGHYPAQNPELNFAVPESLQGGINLASNAFRVSDSEELIKTQEKHNRGLRSLFDGYGFNGYGLIHRKKISDQNNTITIQIADPQNLVPVAGMALNPTSGSHPETYLKNFELQLSEDGSNYKTVLKSQLKINDTEQFFELENITMARFARLVMLSSAYELNSSRLSLGEWKVIADPDFDPTQGLGHNLADPRLGGFVAWAEPALYGNWNSEFLNPDSKKRYIRYEKSEDWQWVIGFHHQRAAKIQRIEMIFPELNDKQKSFDSVILYVSEDGPAGPWKRVKQQTLNGSKAVITLDQPTWARYVRFAVPGIPRKEYRHIPTQVKIFEQPVTAEYKSVLGEWGEYSTQAIYEKLSNTKSVVTEETLNNHTKSRAHPLQAQVLVSESVQIEHSDQPDWYQFTTPEGHNHIQLSLFGNPTISVIMDIVDSSGSPVPYTVTSEKLGKKTYDIATTAGQTIYIKVEEPPRNVIFAWDTSGSTSRFHPIIFQALNRFTDGVIPQRDTVNFIPFGGNLLMDQWYGEPYYLKTVLSNYDRKDDSSHAEDTLIKASKALAKRPGSKSIVLITDALTGQSRDLWKELRKVTPRIFAMGLIQGGSGDEHNIQFDLMQTWSKINNGEFDKVSSVSDLEIAFDKAASKLRQPAHYSLQVASDFQKAPGPGKLSVLRDKQNLGVAVELILDASGSMLKRLNGERRINIAKSVFNQTLDTVIPEGTPLAIRVFGDQQANACRTDLRLPLQPLNKNKAKTTIDKVNARNLAKTPIADSLSKISTDLKNHKGKKVVLVLTDGEETCEGDPEKVINELIENGIDLRLNIVGFAIDDEQLKDQFQQWSNLGQGKYFDADNQESLKTSITEALKTPYSVFDRNGSLVAEGLVNGEPVVLPAGLYEIKVFDTETKVYKDYRIEGEKQQMIKLD